MLPFPAFNRGTITTKKDAVLRCRNFGSSVPFRLLQSNESQPLAAQVLSRVSMWPIPLMPLTAAVRTLNVPNVSSSGRDLALAALCFLRADFPAASPVTFYEQIPSAFHSVPGASYPGSCLRSSDIWVRYSHHASTSLSSTLLFTRVCPPSIPPLLASDPTFSAVTVSQLCYRRQGCRGKRFRFVGGRCCWHRLALLSASTSSRINRCHEGTMIHARELYS